MKKLLLFLIVMVSLFSCSDESIETDAPNIDASSKTVTVVLVGIPDGFLGQTVYIFTMNAQGEIYAFESAEAQEDATVAVTPTPGNTSFDIVVFIPSDPDWLATDSFVDGYYSVMTGLTNNSEVLVTNTWENETDLESTSMSGLDAVIEADLTINGLSDPTPAQSEFEQGDIIVLNSTITDNLSSGVASATYFIDGTQIVSYSQSPYSVNFNTIDVSPGDHTIRVVAQNNDGNTAEDEIDIRVVLDANEGPSVSIISISNGQQIERQTVINLAPSVTDPDDGVARVEFRINNTLVETDTEAPFTYEWDTFDNQIGTVTVEVTAFDESGASRSDAVNVVLVDPANYNPRITITNPDDGDAFSAGAIINIDVNASDVENDLNGVEIYINGGFSGFNDVSPYGFTWDTTGLTAGDYTIMVIVYDNDFNTGTDSITITIN